jgi:hypothetical protein
MKFESFVAVAALAAAGIAGAQQTRVTDPADPATAVPPIRYQSVYTGFRGQPEDKQSPWREANEEVRRLGGHLGHVQGAAAAPKPAPKVPAQDDQGGRK